MWTGKRSSIEARIDDILTNMVTPLTQQFRRGADQAEALLQRIAALEQRMARLETLHMHPKHASEGLIPGMWGPQDAETCRPADQQAPVPPAPE